MHYKLTNVFKKNYIIEDYYRAVLSLFSRRRDGEKRKNIYCITATGINPKQTLRVIHWWKFSFTEVDAGRLKHNNEVVIPRDPSSREPDGRERKGVELGGGPRFVIQNSRKGVRLLALPATFERNFRSA